MKKQVVACLVGVVAAGALAFFGEAHVAAQSAPVRPTVKISVTSGTKIVSGSGPLAPGATTYKDGVAWRVLFHTTTTTGVRLDCNAAVATPADAASLLAAVVSSDTAEVDCNGSGSSGSIASPISATASPDLTANNSSGTFGVQIVAR